LASDAIRLNAAEEELRGIALPSHTPAPWVMAQDGRSGFQAWPEISSIQSGMLVHPVFVAIEVNEKIWSQLFQPSTVRPQSGKTISRGVAPALFITRYNKSCSR